MTSLEKWTVQYALPEGMTEPVAVAVPHAWGTEVDLRWEGPAIYRTRAVLPDSAWLVFEGVSYEARIHVNSVLIGEHRGIWDAFAVDGRKWSGQEVEITVEVTKNGGPRFPVRNVLSGFLPYVFGTYGGIYKPVRVISSQTEPKLESPRLDRPRVRAKGAEIFVDDRPFFTKGVLSWGWYPSLRHQNPDIETIRREVALAKAMGFNLIKFCLWLPPHAYLEEMRAAGLEAWIELPLWDPDSDPVLLAAMKRELERIVLQYRHHPNILFWTCGCELSAGVPQDFRRELYEMVVELTGSEMVKDNSGGSEMYGAHPKEFGGYYDYHPYCDLPYFSPVLDSLLNGPRESKPILLGEFNDYDMHRDLVRIAKESPYWASSDPALNDQGVRWQMDLPRVLQESHWAQDGTFYEELRKLSAIRSNFIRQVVFDEVAMRGDIAGTVLTGLADTPISSSGVIDDWGQAKDDLRPSEWNANPMLFLIPRRSPPWIHGGNRPGYLDPRCVWSDEPFWRIGVRGEFPSGRVLWSLSRDGQTGVIAEGLLHVAHGAIAPREIGTIELEALPAGSYILKLGDSKGPEIWSFDRPDWKATEGWEVSESAPWVPALGKGGRGLITGRLDEAAIERWRAGQRVLCFLESGPTLHRPFWREGVPWPEVRGWIDTFASSPALQYSVATDCVIDLSRLESELGIPGKPLLTRIDTRTYAEEPYVAVFRQGSAQLIATTLRPHGCLGAAPTGIHRNPSGCWLLGMLLQSLESL